MKFKKKPAAIEATQWFRNGDHPQDGVETTDDSVAPLGRRGRHEEGKVVRFFTAQHIPGGRFCGICGNLMQHHGMMGENALNEDEVVHPGDYIVTDAKGRYYTMRPEEFEALYEPYDPKPNPDQLQLKEESSHGDGDKS